MAVLDTTFLIDLERGSVPAQRRLRILESDSAPLRIPAAVWIEYLAGLTVPQKAVARGWLEAGASFQPVTREIAEEAVRLHGSLARAGSRLSWHDLQVAATASHLREPLVTNDANFRSLSELEILDH